MTSSRSMGSPRRRPLRSAFVGAGHLLRGAGVWISSPRMMAFGAIPALIVGVVYIVVIIVVITQIDSIVAWATPFADNWVDVFRVPARVAGGLALIVATALLAVATFTAVTLAVGGNFYEKIWRATEQRLGAAPAEPAPNFWASVGRATADGLITLLSGALAAIIVLASGLIPIVGPIIAPVLAALSGGWLLTVELTAFAFDARGMDRRTRRRLLARSRAKALGFGVPTYLLFLVPFGAAVAMPAAVAGATTLSRSLLEEPLPAAR